MMTPEAIAKKVIGFILAIASIGLAALLFVWATRHKNKTQR